jgi:precorrin-4/cobalt-precorrin-4 C11-methyltransferase
VRARAVQCAAVRRTAKLWFLGGGPGAPDLLTVRAARALADADVVIWGASLIDGEQVVAEHARADAERGSWPPATRAVIHAVYDRARDEGLVVARLMWGDPAIFATLRDEVREARARGLEYEIVPGVTSLCAAAAALGVELTRAPDTSPPLILTAPRDAPLPGQRVGDVARVGATMAIFMGGSRGEQLQDELIEGGYGPQTRCAVAHRVTWGDEVVVECRLDELARTIADRGIERHTLILVGPALARDNSQAV